MSSIASVLTILTDSAGQTDRASPSVNGVTPDDWLPPGEAWWASFAECVERQLAEMEQGADEFNRAQMEAFGDAATDKAVAAKHGHEYITTSKR